MTTSPGLTSTERTYDTSQAVIKPLPEAVELASENVFDSHDVDTVVDEFLSLQLTSERANLDRTGLGIASSSSRRTGHLM